MTYMIELVAFMRALSLFDEVLETAHSYILQDLIEGNGELLRQFKLVVDDHRDDASNAKAVAVADRLIAEAYQFMAVLSTQIAEPLDELKAGVVVPYRPKRVLPTNPQPLYDAVAADEAEAELTAHLIDHLARGT